VSDDSIFADFLEHRGNFLISHMGRLQRTNAMDASGEVNLPENIFTSDAYKPYAWTDELLY
jgi:hypothetical protein